MDIVLESVFSSMDFSDTLFDMMVDDIFVDSAMEETNPAKPSTSSSTTPQNTQQPKPASTQQNSSQNTQQQNNNTNNKPAENASDKDEEDDENTKKPAPGFLDKLKSVVQWFIDTISNISYNIGKRFTIIQNTGKNFEAKIKRLEKKYEPRFGINLDIYDFNLKVLDDFKTCTDKQYDDHKERTLNIMNDYEKVLHNNMTDEDFIQKNEDLKDFSAYKGKFAEMFSKQIGFLGTSVDDGKEIMRSVREKFKGEAKTINIKVDRYNKCRTDIRNYNTIMQGINNKIRDMKNESEEIKRKLQIYTRNAIANAKSTDSFSKCFSNCIKYFEEPLHGYLFYVTNYNEYIVNCMLIVTKCLGG